MNSISSIREEAFKLASSKTDISKVMEDPTYEKYGSIYIATTANVVDTMKLYKNCNDVLAIGGTGAHCYEAILNGATTVDMFDVNELQKLYFEYMYTAIMHLDYETFIKHFTLANKTSFMHKSEIKDLLSEELYNKLVKYLPKDVEFVFSPLYDYYDSFDLLTSNLFITDHPINLDYLKRNASFYNEDEYYKLQKILRKENCQIKYKTVSLTDVPSEFDKQYDLIVLDNLLQYYKDIPELETPYLTNLFIQKKLSNLLEDEGVIQVNYGFGIAAEAFKEKFNIPSNFELPKDTLLSILPKNIILREEQENGINIPLVERYGDYSYDFITGVEIEDGANMDNLVLTYKKKR